MEDTHRFENTVVAVLTSGDEAGEAVDRLAGAGFEVEVLEGESGSAHLEPEGDGGFWASIKKAASALGDEKRVLEQLDASLAEGRVVISVDLEDRDGKEAISILREHGEYLWKFGDWTFTPIEV
ncbi:MAG: hypothetical protein WD274_06885 [Acidimicrobiia bacterium]